MHKVHVPVVDAENGSFQMFGLVRIRLHDTHVMATETVCLLVRINQIRELPPRHCIQGDIKVVRFQTQQLVTRQSANHARYLNQDRKTYLVANPPTGNTKREILPIRPCGHGQ